MLQRYHNKTIMGHPVEISWFKDLKKARARMYDEQRQGGRAYSRQGFRGGPMNARRGMGSPNNRYNGRVDRRRSDSSGFNDQNNRRDPIRLSRSRSFTGSSSRSMSDSPMSQSPNRRPRLSHQVIENPVDSGSRRFTENNSLNNRRPTRNNFRSRSRSSSDPLSISGGTSSSRRIASSFKSQDKFKTSDIESGIKNQDSFGSFTGIDVDAGSSVVSGLIQLKRKNQSMLVDRPPQRTRASSIGSSSSDMSTRSPATRPAAVLKRPNISLSPPFITVERKSKARQVETSPHLRSSGDSRDFNAKRLRLNRSPDSRSESPNTPEHERFKSTNVSETKTKERSPIPTHPAGRWRALDTRDSDDADQSWKRNKPAKHRQPRSPVADSDTESLGSMSKTNENDMNNSKQTDEVADSVELIRDRKDTLSQEYKRDCEVFTAVVRTLISKDAELEGRLMPLLKEVLHERGQKCIEQLRTFITEHQPDSAADLTKGGEQAPLGIKSDVVVE